MTTLIAVYSSDGCEGRCDTKCYEATEPDCHCVCGGRNHGVGLSKAIDNTRELADQWIEAYTKEHNLAFKPNRWEIPAKDPQQLTLF